MNAKLEIVGLAKVQAAIKRSPAVARAYLAGTVTSSTRAVAERARQLVRVRTGQLRDAIAFDVRGLSGAVGISGGPAADYWRHVEFGTERTAAQPFFRPAGEAQQPAFEHGAKGVGPALERDFVK